MLFIATSSNRRAGIWPGLCRPASSVGGFTAKSPTSGLVLAIPKSATPVGFGPAAAAPRVGSAAGTILAEAAACSIPPNGTIQSGLPGPASTDVADKVTATSPPPARPAARRRATCRLRAQIERRPARPRARLSRAADLTVPAARAKPNPAGLATHPSGRCQSRRRRRSRRLGTVRRAESIVAIDSVRGGGRGRGSSAAAGCINKAPAGARNPGRKKGGLITRNCIMTPCGTGQSESPRARRGLAFGTQS